MEKPKIRNADATRERILSAATAEFSAFGIAGARVDRIAEGARCNKNLIYVYFGNKEALFETVLQKNLERVYEEVPFTPEDLSIYATRLFDFTMANPDLMRLMTWLGLEQRETPPERIAIFKKRTAALTKAQRTGAVAANFPSHFLIAAISTLATAWAAPNPFGASLDSKSLTHRDELRRNIAQLVRALCAPQTPMPPQKRERA